MSLATAQPPLSSQHAGHIAAILRQYWGFDQLRPLQQDAIAAALAHRDSLLVMPTGGGKSLCYQVPPLVDDTLDLVVSPLISLMKDQVDGLIEAGVPAAALHSGLTPQQRRDIFADLRAGQLRLLFTSPERLVTDGFLQLLQDLKIRRFAIDEAHCISQWGHDFRPEYRQLASLRQHFPDASFHAFTATATPRVREDIVAQLQLRDPHIFVGAVDRPNLVYRVVPKVDASAQTAEVIARHLDEAVIVYCISRKETESLAAWLTARGIKSSAYHAGMTPPQRHTVQEDFASERLNVVVATVAFGMGIDRSNVRCVIHTGMPKSIEHYQQETGRAGRDGLEAECVLLYNAGDAIKWEGLMQRSADETGSAPEVLQASLALLSHMQRFANATVCRHRALSEYFGQSFPPPHCGACDVCLNEIESMPDSTVIAQKIISCVARVQQRFGVGHIVDVLLGSETENIRKYRHEELSTYGLLKDLNKKSLTALTYQLLDQSLLSRTEGDYPKVILNPASMEVLRGQRQVKLVQPATKVRKQTAKSEIDLRGVDKGLMDHLRAWRRTLAETDHVPPYTIFADTTLVALARMRPTKLTSLPLITGIGQKRAQRFGQSLCDTIATYCRDHNLAADALAPPPPSSGPPQTRSVALQQAFDCFDERQSIESVAQKIGRTVSTTCKYLEQYIRDMHPSDITAWVAPATQKRITDALAAGPVTALRPIYEKLDCQIPYEAIRIVLAHLNQGR